MNRETPVPGAVVRTQFVPEVRSVNEENRQITFVASTEAVDRYGDIIRVAGWQLENYKKNPVFLFAHDSRQPPVGKTVEIHIENNPPALVQTVEFADKETYGFADTVYRLFKGGFLRAVSVGFQPLEKPKFLLDEEERITGYEFTKQDLLELSAVPIPANPEALGRGMDPVHRAFALGVISDEEEREIRRRAIDSGFGEGDQLSTEAVASAEKTVEKENKEKQEAAAKAEKEQKPQEEKADAGVRESGGVASEIAGFRKSVEKAQKTIHEKLDAIGGSLAVLPAMHSMMAEVYKMVKDKEPDPDDPGEGDEPGENALTDDDNIERTVCPYKADPIAPKDAKWDAAAEMAKQKKPAGWRRMCTVIVGDPQNKTSYKLPHHEGSGFHVVPRGVRAALGRFEKTQMSDSDRPGARSHLVKHQKAIAAQAGIDFDGDAFEVRMAQLGDAMRMLREAGLEEEEKAVEEKLDAHLASLDKLFGPPEVASVDDLLAQVITGA